MSRLLKIFLCFVITFSLLYFNFFKTTFPTFAADPCSSKGVTVTQDLDDTNRDFIKLNFQINDGNVINSLKSSYLALYISNGKGGSNEHNYQSTPFLYTGVSNFSITINQNITDFAAEHSFVDRTGRQPSIYIADLKYGSTSNNVNTAYCTTSFNYATLPLDENSGTSCADYSITYNPTFFPENQTKATLNFHIGDSEILKKLIGRNMRLYISPDFRSPSFKLDGSTPDFSIDIDNPNYIKNNTKYTAGLDYTPIYNQSGNYLVMCGQIKYQIGYASTDKCQLLSPSGDISYPNNQNLPISFQGISGTDYAIRTRLKGQTTEKVQGITTTDASGRGDKDISLTDYGEGSQVEVMIAPSTGYSSPTGGCGFTVTTSLQAPTIPPLGTPPPGATIVPPHTPTIALPTVAAAAGSSGAPCPDGKQGVYTAIGCISTDPKGLISDLLKLATGLGGGIALLLMIAGAFQMITSAGNPDGVKKGSEQITSAVIGLLFIIFSVLLLKIIGVDILNIPGFGP